MITFASTISRALLPNVPFITQFDVLGDAVHHRPSLFTWSIHQGIKLWAGRKTSDDYYGTLLRDSHRIIVLSEFHRATLAERVPSMNGKCMLIPPPPLLHISSENNSTLRQQRREMLGVQPEDFVIAFFGYALPRKGIESLFTALLILRAQNWKRNVWLLMIGGIINDPSRYPYYADEIQQMPEKLGIEDQVIWVKDYLSDSDEASAYLRAADACVLPFDDGIALNRSSFAAAAAHALPVITTRGEALEAQFIDHQNVLLCAPKNPKSLADAIDLLMNNSQLYQQLRTGTLELARECFSWEKTLKRTIEALKNAH
jgi:glycosyltransferase involved in cell wall biosynthesis